MTWTYWTAPYPRTREHAHAIRMALRGVKLTDSELRGESPLPQKPPETEPTTRWYIAPEAWASMGTLAWTDR